MSRRHSSEKRIAATALLLMLVLSPVVVGSGRAEDPNPPAESNRPQVRAEFNSQLQETTYRIENNACRITWTGHATDINRGVVTHRANCKAPLREQASMMAALLELVLADHPEPEAFRDLSWGRIAPDFMGCTDMSLRLALAASESSSWDKRRGKPTKGHANQFVALIAEQQQIYSEIADLFIRHGRRLSVASVEKVLIAEANTLPCYSAMKTHGVRPDDKLPFDCQLWFAVKPAGAGVPVPGR